MPPKPSVVVSVLAAAVPLLTVPLGLFGLAIFSGRLVETFQEGGAWMYVLTAAGALLSVLAAATVFAASRWRAWVAPVAGLLAAVLPAAGALATRLAIGNLVNAIANVNPADRALITHAGLSEAWSTWMFGLLLAAALLSLAAGSFAVEFMARLASDDVETRRFNLALALVYGAFSAWLVGVAGQEVTWSHAHQAMAHAAPADRGPLVFQGLVEMNQAQVVAWGVLVLALTVLGVFTLLLRKNNTAVASLLGLLLVPVLVLASRVTLSVPEAGRQALASGAAPEGLISLEGPTAEWEASMRLDDGEVSVDELESERVQAVDVGKKATAQSMQALFKALAQKGVREVELHGVQTRAAPEGIVVPADFKALLSQTSFARVRLGPADEVCGAECDFAVVDDHGVITGGERVPFEPYYGLWPEALDQVVAIRLSQVDPKTLLRAAVTAAGHNSQLVVVMPQ